MKHSGKITPDTCHVIRRSADLRIGPPGNARPQQAESEFGAPSRVTRHSSLATCLSLIVLVSTNNARATAAETDTQGNPYQAIVGRNVFGLKPPPPPPPPEDPLKKNPPPTIKLQGVQTILGRRQVLFKLPAKPPGQPKEESFLMNEGERQGEIEVVQIDMQTEAVKFKNHGQEQLLNMKDDADKPALGAPPPPGIPPGALPGILPGVPPPSAAFNPSAPGTITTIGSSKMIPQRPMRAPTPAGGMPMGNAVAPQASQPTPLLSREEQEIAIEVQRQHLQNQGDPTAALFPPTSLTQPTPPSPIPK